MKNQRVLRIYSLLLNNKRVNKRELAHKFNVSERTINRDISDLRAFLHNWDMQVKIEYSFKENRYILKNIK